MKVVVRELTMVRPAEEPPLMKIRTTCLDLITPNSHTLTLELYRPNGATNFFDTKVMKDALSRALVTFYPLAGRFKQGEDGHVEIDCQGQGALFLEAEADGVINDLVDLAHTTESLKLIPVVDYSMGIDAYPLLVLQVTYYKCGGVSLGIGLHHHVADGWSALHFKKTWSDMARDIDNTLPPLIDRTLLRAWAPPRPVFEHIECHPPPTLKSPPQVPLDNTKTVTSVFKLTRDQIDVLKAKSKEDGNTMISYTSFEILSGHIWKCVCKARGLPDDQETKINIPIDGRARFQPPLPPGYFGNVILRATAIQTTGEIQSKPTWYAASLIHDALAKMNSDYLKSAMAYLEQRHEHNPQAPWASYNTLLAIVSWVRLPVYDTDFGWGRPVLIGPAQIPVVGMCYVLPSPINDGSLSIWIRLGVEQMKLFSKLFYEI